MDNLNDIGVKHDNDKIRPSLVIDSFARALEQVAAVGTFGAKKYSDDGWVTVHEGQKRYRDALYRHLLADGQGIELDYESEKMHLAHVAWNALAILELRLRDLEYQQGERPI